MRSKLLFLLFIICQYSFSQNSFSLTSPDWKTGTEKNINGYKILRVKGDNSDSTGITNISFIDYKQMIAEFEKTSKAENWSEEKKKLFLKSYENSALGGKIDLYIQRPAKSKSDFKYFTVVVKNVMEVEVFSQTLVKNNNDKQNPKTPFVTNSSIALSDATPLPFFIYVTETIGTEKRIYKFEVK